MTPPITGLPYYARGGLVHAELRRSMGKAPGRWIGPSQGTDSTSPPRHAANFNHSGVTIQTINRVLDGNRGYALDAASLGRVAREMLELYVRRDVMHIDASKNLAFVDRRTFFIITPETSLGPPLSASRKSFAIGVFG